MPFGNREEVTRISTERIANRQLFVILFTMRTTIAISLLPVLTAANAAQDAWAAGVVSFVGAAILVILLGALGTRFPEETVMEYSQKLAGTVLGKIVGLAYLGAFLWMAAVDVRIYAEAIVTGFLAKTPLVFIVTSMVLASAITAYTGIEVIGRNADFIFPFFLAMILASLLAAIPQMELVRLQPVLARGIKPVLAGSFVPTLITLQMMTLPVLIPSTLQPKMATRTAIWALALASLALVATAVVTVAVLGADPGARSVLPFFRMIRAVRLTELLERIEALAMVAWGFGLFIGSSTYQYCGARGLAQVLNLGDYRPLVPPMAVIWIALSVHAVDDMFQFRSYFRPEVVGPHALLLILVPQSVLWTAYAARRIASKVPRKQERGGRQ